MATVTVTACFQKQRYKIVVPEESTVAALAEKVARAMGVGEVSLHETDHGLLLPGHYTITDHCDVRVGYPAVPPGSLAAPPAQPCPPPVVVPAAVPAAEAAKDTPPVCALARSGGCLWSLSRRAGRLCGWVPPWGPRAR